MIYARTISNFAFFYFVLFIYPDLTVPGGRLQEKWERDFLQEHVVTEQGEVVSN